MADFLLLFRGGQAAGGVLTAEDKHKDLERWKAWIEDLRRAGSYKEGFPLDHAGKLVSGGKKIVTEGAYGGHRDGVGGYVIVSAGTLDEAVEIARGCPILDRDGTVEVRPTKEKAA